METITSRPYSTESACEKCVFGRGEHAGWCDQSGADDLALAPLSGDFDDYWLEGIGYQGFNDDLSL